MRVSICPVLPRFGRFGLLLAVLLGSPSLLAMPNHDHWSHPLPALRASPMKAQLTGAAPWHRTDAAHPQLADRWEDKKDKRGDKDDKYRDKRDKKRYDKLSPEQRERLRERRELFKSLPPEERERIERAREKFRNLPPERREELKEKWHNMSPEQRREYHRRMEEKERYRDRR